MFIIAPRKQTPSNMVYTQRPRQRTTLKARFIATARKVWLIHRQQQQSPAPVSSEIYDFVSCAHAQINILHIK